MAKHRGSQCCAYGCKKRMKSGARSDSEGTSDEESAKKKEFPRTFHVFPSDPERRKIWIQHVRRKDWEPSKSSRLCSDHFLEKHMDRTGQTVRLRGDAVPSRFKMFPRKKETRRNKQQKSESKKESLDPASCNSTTEAPSTSIKTLALDHDYCNTKSQEATLKKRLLESQIQIIKMRSRLKIETQRTRRLKKKVTALKMVIKDLYRERGLKGKSGKAVKCPPTLVTKCASEQDSALPESTMVLMDALPSLQLQIVQI